MILGERAVDAIYRIPDAAILYHTEDCLYGLSRCEPGMFGDRGTTNLGILASAAAKSATWSHPARLSLFYQSESGEQSAFAIRRIAYDDPLSFWHEYYGFALEMGGGNLDGLIERFVSEGGRPNRLHM